MNPKVVEVDSVKMMKHLTITVTYKRQREFAVRAWIARRLFLLAAWVLNCGIQVKEEPPDVQ